MEILAGKHSQQSAGCEKTSGDMTETGKNLVHVCLINPLKASEKWLPLLNSAQHTSVINHTVRRSTQNVTLEDTWISPTSCRPYWVLFLFRHTHHIGKTWKLMMCSSYSLTSQRTQTLLKSGRKWVRCYDVWHGAVDRPPWSPRASKLMDTNVSPCENVSPKEKMESPGIWREEREQRWPGDISEALLRGRGRMFLKMPVFFRVPCTWTAKTTSVKITSSSSSQAVLFSARKEK